MQQNSQSAYLIIHLGNRWTDILRLQPADDVLVGRSSANEIVVPEDQVSRQHAKIYFEEGVWRVADLKSRNGTMVNGVAIEQPHILSAGDRLQVGSCRLTFTKSLPAGFAIAPTDQGKGDRGQTVALDPTIVQRLSNSRWTSDSVSLAALTENTLTDSNSDIYPEQRDGLWGFFYRLVAELVAAETPTEAAQCALELLLDKLQIQSGGVVAIEGDMSTLDRATEVSKIQMTVLATKQAVGESYRRVSDYLVQSIVQDKQAVLARNVQEDADLNLARESGRKDTQSIICAPLRSVVDGKATVIGLLHVYTSTAERMLSNKDLDVVVGVADNLAIALGRQQATEGLVRDLDKTQRKLSALEEQLEASTELIGSSKPLRDVKRSIQRAGPTNATVLIRGESGVGKELVARAIHRSSKRADGPLICLNCAALAPTLLESELFGHEKGAFTGATERKIGKFEAADGGTLLLDEIGEMSAELQAKFLRVLEGQPFERLGGNRPIQTDVRVIAATNRDLEIAVEEKTFRSDLYYRLRVIEIYIPPLRERLDDVPQLSLHFLDVFRQHTARRIEGFSPRALEILCRHSWPGNVRELRNEIERAVVLGGGSNIELEDLRIADGLQDQLLETPASLPVQVESQPLEAAPFKPQKLAEVEKAHILAMLKHAGGNKTKASQKLGIERSTLDRKLKRYREREKKESE